ncbi:hypothetical protein B0H10DRAFT_2046820 [Mycena sp. CBHHK59/15]|nr:hypothetical protein B0H10DRAFT_2046820 [Mycena sp. CBHHK59/15]
MLSLSWSTLQLQVSRGLSFVAYLRQSDPSGQIACLQNSTSTFVDLITCFDGFTVSDGFYTEDTYAAAQPNSTELSAWNGLVASLFTVDGNCTSVAVPSVIAGIYDVALFTDYSSGAQYCVASESTSIAGVYAKGWGLVVVPATRTAVQRGIHLSAPHPAFDLFTPEQAGALFQSTGARSLLVAGRVRSAYISPSDCVIPVSNTTEYFKTDPAHDVAEPFFTAAKAIQAWQTENGGCPTQSCAFIQMHGKAASTCPTDTMFLSAGIGNSKASVAWYTDAVDRPIKRLKAALVDAFPTWNISLPSDSLCTLTATDNVSGRLVNGIAEDRVCTTASNAALATGDFIHIEQAIISRQADAYSAWTAAMLAAFTGSE